MPVGPAALPAGTIFLLGLWTGVWQWLQPEGSGWGVLAPVSAAVAALCIVLLPRWDRPGRGAALAALLVLLLAAALLCRAQLSASAAAIGNLANRRILLQTGRYHLPYTGGGSVWPLLAVLAALSGGAAALLLRRRWGTVCLLAGLAALLLRLLGLADGGWPLAGMLVGGLLCLLNGQSLRRQTLRVGAALLLAGLCALASLIPGLVPAEGNGAFLHRLRYESHAASLPEGDLARGHRSGAQAALSVTMERWTPIYLRGYAAGEYTGRGWAALDGESLLADDDMLYTLQHEYFFPSTQIAAAWQDASGGESLRITVVNAGACRERIYLPYGAETSVPDAADLTGEGGRVAAAAVEAEVYPVESSYLLQEQLSRNADDTPYRMGEAVYRRWVYDHYLAVPQSTYEALTRDFAVRTDMTTTQAKEAVVQYLASCLTYSQSALVYGGDVAAELAGGGRQGSDIHYATMAALLLRCCGIPARYAEGYVITRQQAETMADGATLLLTERSSHAWAEYYLDGVGWLPFDATPGYTDLVTYQLPEDGSEGDGGDTQQPETAPQEREPEVTPETHQPESQHLRYIQSAALVLLAVLMLLLAALAVHAAVCRRRLRRAAARYQDPDCRRGCGYILCTVHELLRQMGVCDGSGRQESAAALLTDEEDLRDLLQLEREVWFSGHAMTEQQRRRCLQLLESVRRIWQEQTPAPRRFIRRFITCKVF